MDHFFLGTSFIRAKVGMKGKTMEEFIAVFALAVVVAILFNWGQPKLFASQNASLVKWQGNYAGKTLMTAAVIFAAIVAAGFLMKATVPATARAAAGLV
jgi:hypothetical protein